MTINVLIVEENPVARSFLCNVVRESFSDDLMITECADLDSARRHVGAKAQDRYELFMFDLDLPEDNGMALLAEAADSPAIKVVTTIYSDDDHLFPALQHGADGYLLKEDRFEVLVEQLQKIVRGRPPLSPSIARRLLTHFRTQPSALPSAHPAHATGSASSDSRSLTPHETEVLTYLSKGFAIKEIASLTDLDWFAINDLVKSIYRKLNVS